MTEFLKSRPDHEVVMEHRTPEEPGVRPGRMLLLKRPHDVHPYVVCWLADEDNRPGGQWHNGQYCEDLQQAKKRFCDRKANW